MSTAETLLMDYTIFVTVQCIIYYFDKTADCYAEPYICMHFVIENLISCEVDLTGVDYIEADLSAIWR